MNEFGRSTSSISGDELNSRGTGPFVGTRPFSDKDAVFFFGRDREALSLTNLIVPSTLTVLYGDSGVGKSSLINARLVDALDEVEPDWLLIPFFEWQPDCLPRLEQAVHDKTGRPVQDGLARTLLGFARETNRPVLLVLDQFEEYFLYHPRGLPPLESELAKLINRRVSPVRVLFSLRSDGLFLLDRLRLRVPQIFASMVSVEALDERAATDCIVRPLQAYNRILGREAIRVPEEDSDLVKAIVSGADEDRILARLPGRGRRELQKDEQRVVRIVAPFLQMALEELWREDVVKLGHDHLELATLRQLAGLSEGQDSSEAIGAIAQKYVDSILREFSHEENEVCSVIFERMVLPSGQKVAVTLVDLSAALTEPQQKLAVSLLDRLSQDQARRLIKMVAGPQDGEPHYQIVHDAMAIPLLGWVERWKSDEKAARARREAEEEATRAREEAEEKAARARKEAAEEAARARKDAEQKAKRRLINYAEVFCVIVVFLIALTWWKVERVKSEAERARLQTERIIVSGLRPEQTRISRLKADLRTSTNSGYGAVWANLQKVYELYRFNAGDGERGQVHAADFASDSKSILAIDLGGTLHQWPLGGDRKDLRNVVIGPSGPGGVPAQGRSLRVSPLGDVAAVGFSEGSVLLIDPKDVTRKPEPLLINGAKPHHGSVFSVVFSLDGSLLVTTSRGGNLVMWERSPPSPGSGAPARSDPLRWTLKRNIALRNVDLKGTQPADTQPADIWAVDIDRANKAIAIGLTEGRVCLLWLDQPDRPVCKTADDQGKTVKSVKFMPGQSVLVSAGNDAKVTIWTVDSSGRQITPWPIPLYQDNDIWDLDFNRAGSLLATSSWDGSVHIYQTVAWRLLNTVAPDFVDLIGRKGGTGGTSGDTSFSLRTVRFDPTSSMLVTASLDHSARVWSPLFDRTSVSNLSYRLAPNENSTIRPITSVAIGKAGDRIAFTDGATVYLRLAGQAPEALPAPSEDPPQKLHFTEVLMPSEDQIVASAIEPRLAVWTRSTDGKWLARAIALPGDKVSDDRGMAMDDGRSVLAIVTLAGGQASILLCPLAHQGPEWTCATAAGSATKQIVLGADLKPEACGDQTHVSIALSRSGRLIGAGAGSCPIQVFDRQNPSTPPKSFPFAEDFNLTSLDFSPDDKALVGTSSRNPQVRVWNLADGTSRNINHHFSPSVTAARFSPSGRWIISTSYDNTVVVADANSGEKLTALSYRNSLLNLDIASTPKGTLMATGSEAGDVNVMRFFENATEVTSFAESVLQDVAQ